ncbi:hypothetical protein HDU88_007318 [Geranomyces variabilis]|nr:hypothetical protein HDU88_007318 [Geranomyces variabilis]
MKSISWSTAVVLATALTPGPPHGTAYYNTTFPKFFENPHADLPPPADRKRFLSSISRHRTHSSSFTNPVSDEDGATFTTGNWAGINHFYLAPLYAKDPETLRFTLDKIQAAGFKVIRTFIQQQYYECAKTDEVAKLPDIEDGQGNFNEEVMQVYERVFEEIHKRGMKVILPIRNGDNFGSSPCDVYCAAAGGKLGAEGGSGDSPFAQKYYSDAKLNNQFDRRIDYVLNYKMRNFENKRLGQLDQLVLAFEPENEPFMQLADDNPLITGPWLCDRAKRIKAGLQGSNILIATGATGGSWEHNNMRENALECPEIDVIAIHGYFDRSETNKWEKILAPTMKRANAANKLVLVEEWFSRYNKSIRGAVNRKTTDMRIQNLSMQKAGVPAIYWDAMTNPEGTLCAGGDWAKEGDDISVNGPWWSVVADLVSWKGDRTASQPRWGSFLTLPSRRTEATPYVPAEWQALAEWKERMIPSPSPSTTTSATVSSTRTTTRASPTATKVPTPPPTTKCSHVSMCSGEQDCVNNVCVPCTWGCITWNCNVNVPCRPGATCLSGICRADQK